MTRSVMKVGDIVKPSKEWIEQVIAGKRRFDFITLKDRKHEILEANKYLNEQCFGIITDGTHCFSVRWLNQIPSIITFDIKNAWWSKQELELVEACEPIWEKYITNPYPEEKHLDGLEPEDYDEQIWNR